MGVHPQVQFLLQMMESRGLPPLEQLGVQEARQAFITSATMMSKAEKKVKTEDRMIQGAEKEIAIRIYTPEVSGLTGALVYYHGGGWVIGNIETHDALCHTVAAESGCIVVSVDYGLAPESKFPEPVEDAYLAAKWAYEHASEIGVDPKRIAVGGDSAGGNLAAAVTYLAVERKDLEIAYQMLLYPSTSFEPTESYEKYSEGYYLTKGTMEWFREQYLTSVDDTASPLAAPMLIPDAATKQLPPAFIMTAEFDPLCDGGEAFANKLKDAGVEVRYVCYPGMIHGFLGMTEFLTDGKKAVSEIASELKAKFVTNVSDLSK
ncbi:acetyl esterase [Mesobacillus persicus]|uniref:Acetyl esterase n=1 Tax=Mesobacillus persicus TaxID=930146 RepID=A0A1H8HJ37_9BACI|nr:alpha/beta hydrolase [Mesobacillus persicus]SEN56252.1 acetyl esterase [Mesobacillus persicus]